ncbi:MAG: polyketide cyclase [Rikenellaceae bacterium]|nr:polyketide cyclase [Rikenellaceae bacterium]
MADVEKYESHQVVIRKPESLIYTVLSDFKNFSPALEGQVEDWKVEGDSCSFKVKGITAGMKIVDRIPSNTIKIEGDQTSPMPFTFWIQLKQVSVDDTRMRLTLHTKLNMMMKMMLGKKLQEGINKMADSIAESFNRF